MNSTAKSNRLHIGLFGRTNVGKSTLLNIISGQNVALTSPIAGTTTDVVEKSLELSSLGPVVILDTAGVDDTSPLASARKSKTIEALSKCDVAILVLENNIWGKDEDNLVELFKKYNIKYLVISNKYFNNSGIDPRTNSLNNNIIIDNIIEFPDIKIFSSLVRDTLLKKIISEIQKKIGTNSQEIELISDIVSKGEIVVLVAPIDTGAPKGRLIMPQVQTLRALLDIGAISITVQPEEYKKTLGILTNEIKLVICDSQVIKQISEITPENISLTTFSILFARLKGDLSVEVAGANTINSITAEDKILISEACSHHAQTDDIATVKIPNLLKKYLGFSPKIFYSHGKDYPKNLKDFKLIIHCGSCMLTRKEKLNRIALATYNNISFTNYGLVISFLNGSLSRTVKIFGL